MTGARGLGLVLLLAAASAAAEPRPIPISVDPRLELAAIIHVLAASHGTLPPGPIPAFELNELPYSQAVKKRFWAYRDDKVVLSYLRLYPIGLDSISALALMMEGFDAETLAFNGEKLPSHFSNAFSVDHPKERAELFAFANQLPAFARRSAFSEFFRAQRQGYKGYEDRVKKDLQGRDFLAEFEDYSGMRIEAREAIYVCPLFPDYASSIDHRGAVPSISAYIGPTDLEDGKPVFEYSGMERKIWQELGHAALDSLSDGYDAKVAASRPLFDRIPEGGKCDFWRNCVRQYIARSVGYRLLQLHRNPGSAGEFREAPSFYDPITKAVTTRLLEFESHRELYPTLKEFYPRLLDVFIELEAAARPGK